ncbi:Rxlr effector candidate protein [Globisporangium polare]
MPSTASPATALQRTILWVLACLCCLALGSIASFSTAHYMPHIARKFSVFADEQETVALELLQTAPLAQYPSNSKSNSGASLNSSLRGTHSSHGANATAAALNEANATANDRYARGVIISLHNGIVSMGVSLIRELRCLGNTELIQVYHCLPDELSEEAQALLTRNDSNVEIVDVCSDFLSRSIMNGGDPTIPVDNVFAGDEVLARSFQSYWLKPLALYHTKLQEVILLDADAVLMRDPADLRTMSGYERTGTTFFYDRVYAMRRFFNRVDVNGTQMLHQLVDTFDYAQFGLSGPAPSQQLQDSFAYRQATAHEMDSSMLLVDKRRSGKAMDVLKHLITSVRFHLKFSWGDKEAFWLAFELAHQPYFFSPWGLSLLDSVPNGDLSKHPESMCGSMAHYVPSEETASETPELLYVNGKALLEPFPLGVDKSITAERSRMFNINPTHITPRYRRRDFDAQKSKSFECMDNMGAIALPKYFYSRLLRRRTHFFAAETKFYEALDTCS